MIKDEERQPLVELISEVESDRIKRGNEYLHVNICSSTGRAFTEAEIVQIQLLLRNYPEVRGEHANILITQVDLLSELKRS